MSSERPFYFRRKHVGGGQLPVIIQGPMGTREGPFTTKDQEVYVRASSVKDYMTDKGGLATYDSNGRMWATATNENLRLQVAAIEDWMSDEGKLRLKDLRPRADQISGATDRREGGTAYHGLFARLDRGQPLPTTIPSDHQLALDAYRRVMRLFVVHEIELAVVCDPLTAGGNLDKTVSPKGVMVPRDKKGNQIAEEVTPDQRVVADVKAAKDPKYFGEFTLQFTPYANGCAYVEEEDPDIRARQEDEAPDELWTPEARLARVKAVHRTPLNVRTDVALLIHVPFKGAHAELFWFNTAEGFPYVQHAMGTRKIRSALTKTFAPAELPVVEGIDVNAPLCPNCTDAMCPGCEPAAVAAEAWGVVGDVNNPAQAMIDPAKDAPAPVAVLTSQSPVLAPPADTFAGQVFAHVKAYTDAHQLRQDIERMRDDSRHPDEGGPSEQDLLNLYRTNARIWRDEHTAAAGEASAAIAARVAAGPQAVAS